MAGFAVVTGGAGFIGSHIVNALVRKNFSVRVIDNLSTGSAENLSGVKDQIEFIEADICDEAAVCQTFDGADVVFHQAALASVPLSVEYPQRVHQACVTGTLTVLDAARKTGVRRVVYAGSSSCYGDQPVDANRESDLPKVQSPYAAAKLAGEYYCNAFFETFGLETVVLRYFNVFGPRQDPDSPYSAVIPLFITRLLAGKSPIVFGDGRQTRDFTFVENVVQGNLLAAAVPQAAGKTFNIADGKATTLLQLIENLNELLGTAIEPEFQPPRPGDVRDSLADVSLATSVLGYRPHVNFQQGLARSIDYYRSVVNPVTT